jgi:hypothetical protein
MSHHHRHNSHHRLDRYEDHDHHDHHLDDSIEDFKAAFVCVTNSIHGHFKHSEDLMKALQGCGRNPTERNISKYWRSHRSMFVMIWNIRFLLLFFSQFRTKI